MIRTLRTLVGPFLACTVAVAGCVDLAGRSGTAEPLEELVNEMLPAVERLSGLRAIDAIRVEMTTPADARRYVESRLDAYLPGARLEGMRRSYAMLGLLPDSLDLRALMLDVYGEQIAGYYDPRTRALYVVATQATGPVEQVLAHELVHAIQDQHANLDSLITQPDANDRQTAAQAAIEGHATLVMFAWLAESMTGDTVNPASLPDPGAGIELMFAGTDQFPVFRAAPRIIRETLLFPYGSGASFVQALWRERPGERPSPFGELLPQSTEQVMAPRARFLDSRDEPTEVRHEAVDGWSIVYENTLGAFETGIFVEEATGGVTGGWRGWDGDRFTLYESTTSAALVWTSVWDDDAAAALFIEHASAFFRSGARTGEIRRLDLGGRPGVRITVREESDEPPDPSAYCVNREGGRVAC